MVLHAFYHCAECGDERCISYCVGEVDVVHERSESEFRCADTGLYFDTLNRTCDYIRSRALPRNLALIPLPKCEAPDYSESETTACGHQLSLRGSMVQPCDPGCSHCGRYDLHARCFGAFDVKLNGLDGRSGIRSHSRSPRTPRPPCHSFFDSASIAHGAHGTHGGSGGA